MVGDGVSDRDTVGERAAPSERDADGDDELREDLVTDDELEGHEVGESDGETEAEVDALVEPDSEPEPVIVSDPEALVDTDTDADAERVVFAVMVTLLVVETLGERDVVVVCVCDAECVLDGIGERLSEGVDDTVPETDELPGVPDAHAETDADVELDTFAVADTEIVGDVLGDVLCEDDADTVLLPE